MAGGIFKQFDSFFDRIFRGTENAQTVGFSKQIVGEFPEDVKFPRLYEFYHGWAAVHTATNVTHQKFMGAGISITSKSKKFDAFVKAWWEVTMADKKLSQLFLSGWITGNGIVERQYTEDGRLGNIEHIPMTSIYKIFRDSYANELKLQQLVDGVLLDLDPKFYGHWMINNPDRQAFGKSIFYSVAAPRRVTTKVDPLTGQPLNPDRTTISLLDAQAKLQNAEVEIKEKMSKPKIFASFEDMSGDQLKKIELEMQDGNSDKYVWAFQKEAKVAEVQINPSSKFDQYGANVNEQIDMAMSFGSKVITHPGGFGYASAQTSVDVLDQYVATIQSDAIEFIRKEIVIPLAKSWGWPNTDQLEIKIIFNPTIKRLRLEDIIMIPDNVLSVLEKRKMLTELNIRLEDTLYEESKAQAAAAMMPKPAAAPGTPEPPKPGAAPGKVRTTPLPEKNPLEKERPDVPDKTTKAVQPSARLVEFLLTHPTEFVKYIDQVVEDKVAAERANLNPQGNAKADHDDMFMGRTDQKKPEITDSSVALQLVDDQEDPQNPLSMSDKDKDFRIKDEDFLDEPKIPGLDDDFHSPNSFDQKPEPIMSKTRGRIAPST